MFNNIRTKFFLRSLSYWPHPALRAPLPYDGRGAAAARTLTLSSTRFNIELFFSAFFLCRIRKTSYFCTDLWTQAVGHTPRKPLSEGLPPATTPQDNVPPYMGHKTF